MCFHPLSGKEEFVIEKRSKAVEITIRSHHSQMDGFDVFPYTILNMDFEGAAVAVDSLFITATGAKHSGSKDIFNKIFGVGFIHKGAKPETTAKLVAALFYHSYRTFLSLLNDGIGNDGWLLTQSNKKRNQTKEFSLATNSLLISTYSN